jgi:hypothetical protein
VSTVETVGAEGGLLDTIDALTEANRSQRDPETECRLMRLRHEAFSELEAGSGLPSWPPFEAPDGAGATSVDQLIVEPRDLTADAVRESFRSYGCTLVPGLFSDRRVDQLLDGMEKAVAAYDAHANGASLNQTRPWFDPVRPKDSYDAEKIGKERKWARDCGSLLAADSPRFMFELIESFDELGLPKLIGEYLGERPALSVGKTVLRRVEPGSPTAWHQDGAFLGKDLRALNVWVALTDCGRDAPTMSIIPRRFNEFVEMGTEDAPFETFVGEAVAGRLGEETPILQPEFSRGDVLLFDDLFLHSTAAQEPGMTEPRYAVESWFFAPSAYPKSLVPVVL